MKIYLAGKITGDPYYKEKFNRFERDLKRVFDVINPANNPEGLSKAEYMRLSFAMIDSADAVLFLPGWTESMGARLEHQHCEYTGKKVLYSKIFTVGREL